MMSLRIALPFAVISALVAAAGCSSSSTPAGATQGDDGGTGADATPQGQTSITFTMKSHVTAGSETHQCVYVTAGQALSFIVAGRHTYTPGSHHMLLFNTDLTAIPTGMDMPGDCYESSNGGYMSHVRGVVYGAQVPTGQIQYPEGVGLQLAGNEVLMMQTHYLNASSTDLDARADVTLTLSDGTGITQHAGVLFFYDPFIDVPPGMKGARASMRCGIRNDITLITASSHYHKRGYDYSAFLDPANGPLATTPFYTSSDWDHPASLAAPLTIPAGSRIRFGCGYDNTGGTAEYFQGQSAQDNEMCMFTGVYYPDMGLQDNLCMTSPDMFGTGAANCSTTLTCLKGCPAGGIKLGAGTADVDPCDQKCFVASCPGSTTKLVALNDCTSSKCATECADASSSACTTCAQTNCLGVASDCFTDTCN